MDIGMEIGSGTDRRIDDALIDRAATAIRQGGIVAFPTETVYGLGANALDPKAVARVFEAKKRPRFDPLILHVGGKEWLKDLTEEIPAKAAALIDALWPGPLSVVLPKKGTVPHIATAGLKGAAFRMPANDIALRLINAANTPVAAPSANPFGAVSPTTADHVREQLGHAVDIIIDGGPCTVGVESTVISFMADAPTLLRPGGTPLEEIEKIIGHVAIPAAEDLINHSPGRAGAHYATSVPLTQIQSAADIDRIAQNGAQNIGLITLAPLDAQALGALPPSVKKIEPLSANGDLREAAANLFAAMRRLDSAGVDAIAALPVPNGGLGLAINDRLARAAMMG